MKTKAIEKIAHKVAKKWYSDEPIVEARLRSELGDPSFGNEKFVEIRTEMVSYEGGDDLMEQIEDKLGYECEPQGGCVYHVYKEI
jgi:hypothetical protein